MIKQGDMAQPTASQPPGVLSLLDRMNGDSIRDSLDQAGIVTCDENSEAS